MKNKIKIEKICISAVFAAIYVVLDIVALEINSVFGGMLKLSFSALPIIIAALLLGPIWSAGVGLIGSFVGQLFSEYGLTATTPLWILPAVAMGLTVGIIYNVLGKSNKIYILIIPTLAGALIRTVLNTLALYIDALIYKYPIVIFGIGLINRIASSLIITVAITFILPPVIKALRKIIN